MARKTTKTTKTAKKSTEEISKKVRRKSADSMNVRVLDDKPTENAMKIKVRKSYLILLVLVFLLGFLVWTFKGFFIVATINGSPITRLSVIQDLERQNGKQVLNSLVTKTLILQEAQKRNITVGQKEIDNEIKKIEKDFQKQGKNFDELLAAQGLTRERVKEQISIQKIIEKMLEKDIKVTDKEVDEYIEKNKEALQDIKPEDLKKQVQQQLRTQKLSDKFQTLLADLQKNAKINYFVNY